MSGRDGTNRAKAGSYEEYLRRLHRTDPAYAAQLKAELAERKKYQAVKRPIRDDLEAAAFELAANCGLKLSKDRGESLSRQIIRQMGTLTDRQLAGWFLIFGQGRIYFNDFHMDRAPKYDDEDEGGESCREMQVLTRQIRAAIEPRKRCAA